MTGDRWRTHYARLMNLAGFAGLCEAVFRCGRRGRGGMTSRSVPMSRKLGGLSARSRLGCLVSPGEAEPGQSRPRKGQKASSAAR